MKETVDASHLKEFVRDALARGVKREEIARGLREAGWPDREVEEGLAAFVDAGLPLPVPRCQASGSPREAFLHLLMFFALGSWVTALGSLLFDFINLQFPLPGEEPWSAAGSLRMGVASLVVAFPVFVLTSRRVRSDLALNPARTLNPVRRWLSYFALFIASLILIGDGVALVLQFLGGDLTVRFLLKSAAVGALAAGVVWWLLRGLKEGSRTAPPGAWFALCALVVAMAGLAVWVAGGPLQARARALDEQRLQDLRQIYGSVNSFYSSHGRLPSTLADCDRSPATFIERKNDPVSGQPYDYEVISGGAFSLSASFDLPSRTEGAGIYGPEADGFWKHGAGFTVFKIDLRASKDEKPARE